jgi:hypothetical protein
MTHFTNGSILYKLPSWSDNGNFTFHWGDYNCNYTLNNLFGDEVNGKCRNGSIIFIPPIYINTIYRLDPATNTTL